MDLSSIFVFFLRGAHHYAFEVPKGSYLVIVNANIILKEEACEVFFSLGGSGEDKMLKFFTEWFHLR